MATKHDESKDPCILLGAKGYYSGRQIVHPSVKSRFALIRLVLVSVTLLSSIAVAQTQTGASISGMTRDCFSSQEIHPAGVDISLVNPKTYPHISQIVRAIQSGMSEGTKANRSLWNSYAGLLREIRKKKSLPRTTSSKDGSFVFRNLRAGQEVIVLGVADREDDPMYFFMTDLRLSRGVNSIVADFNAEQPCDPYSRQKSVR